MKKIVVPALSKSESVTLGVPNIEEEKVEPVKPEIPPKNILGFSLDDLEGYKTKRKELKLKSKEDQFVNEMLKVLQYLDKSQNEYDYLIVRQACYYAEHYFVSGKRKLGDVKMNAVIRVCSHLCNGDEKLVRTLIALVLPKIKKSNVFRRVSLRLQRFFFAIVSVWFRK